MGTSASGSRYEVVWPSGRAVVPRIAPRGGVPTLARKTVAEVWTGLNRGDEIFPLLRERLRLRYADVQFVELRFPRGWDDKEIVARLPGVLREQACEAAICGIGGSPGTTVAAVRMAVGLESIGIPTVSLIAAAYAAQGRELARSLGVDELPLAEYPGTFSTDDENSLRQKVLGPLYEELVAAFSKPVRPTPEEQAYRPRDIVMQGTLSEVQEFFHARQWTDGLPVIPPVVSEVERFLQFTDRSPDEIIAVIPMENREVTVWNVAVNGVMAGCRPEYFPVLLAIVEAICDPEYRLEDVGSSVGWEPLVVLNGPVIKDLDFNCGTAALRTGPRANTSVGRFLRLFTRNVVGCRSAPAQADKGATASGFNVVLAEDEDSAAMVGWPPFSVDCGFDASENVVSVQSAISGGTPFYVSDASALECADSIGAAWGPTCSQWGWQGMFLGKWFPLLVVPRRVAATLARDGWTKERLSSHLWKTVTMPAQRAEMLARYATGTSFNIAKWVEEGRLPASYRVSSDPSRMLPVYLDPRCLGVVVAGDPQRNQVRGFINSSMQGPRVSRKVVLSEKWRSWKAGGGQHGG